MRHKGGHGEGGGGVQLGLIVTPMLDMSFQLMAFFIMTFHPSALEGHIDGNLLPPRQIAQRSKTPVATPMDLPAVDDEPALQDVLLVVVKAVGKGQTEGQRVDGEPSRILLQRPENTEPSAIADSDSTIAEGLKRLTTELKRETGPKANIKIEGDGELKHQYLMEVYDACKQAGYKNISFVAPARERSN